MTDHAATTTVRTGTLTPEQIARERSLQIALGLDGVIFALAAVVAAISGSLTIIAEMIRAAPMAAVEVFGLIMMRRIHRGRTAAFEFGSGKLEQFVNLLIAGGFILGGIWILRNVVALVTGSRPAGTPSGFASAACLLAINTYLNVLAWDSVRRAARHGGSLIMTGQLRARLVKMVSSFVVLGTLTLAALSLDEVIITWADAAGALFVCGFILYSGYELLQAGLPDLVDRSVNEEVQAAINRMLTRHFAEYERLHSVRTRRSGETIYADIVLGFQPTLTLAEVNTRIEKMKSTLRAEVPGADVSIHATSA